MSVTDNSRSRFNSIWFAVTPRLFAEQRQAVKFGQLKDAAEWHPDWTPDRALVIVIPLNMNKRLIKAGVSKLLDSNIQSRRGRKALRDADSSALYPLASNYIAQNLKTALRLQKIAEPHRVEHAHCVALRQQLWYEYGAFIAAAASQEDIHLDSFLLKIKQ